MLSLLEKSELNWESASVISNITQSPPHPARYKEG